MPRAYASHPNTEVRMDDAAVRATLTMKEVAQLLGVSVKTLYGEAKHGRFPVIRLGRTMRVARVVVESILEQGRVPPLGGPNGGKTR
jgi:excisionase family DNA binding protein